MGHHAADMSASLRSERVCNFNGCKEKHSYLLHDALKSKPPDEQSDQPESAKPAQQAASFAASAKLKENEYINDICGHQHRCSVAVDTTRQSRSSAEESRQQRSCGAATDLPPHSHSPPAAEPQQTSCDTAPDVLGTATAHPQHCRSRPAAMHLRKRIAMQSKAIMQVRSRSTANRKPLYPSCRFMYVALQATK